MNNKHLKLEVEYKDNALILPLASGSNNTKHTGGVVGSQLAQHHRQNGSITFIDDIAIGAKLEDKNYVLELSEAIYGGVIFNQFGHFMAESLQRLWFRCGDQKILFLVYPKKDNSYPEVFDDLPEYQKDVFQYLGIPRERMLLVTGDTKVDRLIIPSQGTILGNNYSVDQKYFEYLDKMICAYYHDHRDDFQNRPKYDKIYVSRSHLLGYASFAGESYLDYIMADNGYHIMRPDSLFIGEKIWLFRNAKYIVFSEGSSIHNLELIPNLSSKVCVIARRKRRGIYNTTFMLTIRVKNLCYYDSVVNLSPLRCTYSGNIKEPVASSAISLVNIDDLLDFLKSEGFIADCVGGDNNFQLFESLDILNYFLHATLGPTKPEDFLRQFQILRSEIIDNTTNPYLKGTFQAKGVG